MNYETVVFDLGNTIIRFDHTIAVKKIAERYHIDPKKTYDLFFDSEITHLFEKGLISPEEFHKKAAQIVGIDIPFGEFIGIWNDIFWEDTDACALARELKPRYKLFLLSNVNRSHFEFIQAKFDIIKIFDELIVSYRVGAMKPEKKIFDHVVARAGGDRSRIVYIDDREDLITASTGFGIDSIRFEGVPKLRQELAKRGILSGGAAGERPDQPK